jgi:hypothetical protein
MPYRAPLAPGGGCRTPAECFGRRKAADRDEPGGCAFRGIDRHDRHFDTSRLVFLMFSHDDVAGIQVVMIVTIVMLAPPVPDADNAMQLERCT